MNQSASSSNAHYSHGYSNPNPPPGYPTYTDAKPAAGSASQDYVQGYPPPGYPRS
jgi:hypothetical protein